MVNLATKQLCASVRKIGVGDLARFSRRVGLGEGKEGALRQLRGLLSGAK